MRPDLFLDGPYPNTPGWKGADTSLEAAEGAKPIAGYLRRRVLEVLTHRGPMSADAVARILAVDRLSIRPRVSELNKLGLIYDTGYRWVNDSGKRAIVWTVTTTALAEEIEVDVS